MEEKLEASLKSKVQRGKILVQVSHQPLRNKKSLEKVYVDKVLAADCAEKFKSLKNELGLGGEVGLDQVVAFPGVVSITSAVPEKQLWRYVSKAAVRALDKLLLYRRKEGRRVATEFRQRLESIKKLIVRIEKNNRKSVQNFRDRLAGAAGQLAGEAEICREKMENEVAAFTRGCDISEEVNRLKGHIVEFKSAMKPSEGEAGKKLDFIAQEMQREVNTIGAKSEEFDIARDVITIKSEIEKIREQLRNVE